METAEVVIAGAGIAGIATAHRLAAHHGVRGIVLVDPRPPLTVTSDKTGANYRDWWPARPMVELARRSVEIMAALVESGAPVTMNRRGYLYVSTRPGFAGEVPQFLSPYRAAGLGPIRILSPGAAGDYQRSRPEGLEGPEGADVLLDRDLIRREFSHLSPGVTGAVHARNAGTIDTVALGQHLLEAAIRRGVRLVRGEVVRIDAKGGRISGVAISGEQGSSETATRHFVNAAGPFAGRVAGLMGVSLPLCNALQQKVAVPDPLGAMPPGAPFTISLDPLESLPAGLHIKPDTVAGRPVIKLGCAFNRKAEEPRWDPRGTAEFVDRVLQAAASLVPAMAPYLDGAQRPLAHEAGYYTRTDDDLPLIGPHGNDGAFVVGGLAGYGAMVACAVAEIAASWITGSARPGWTRSFAPDRFNDAAYLAASSAGGASSGAL